MDDMPEEARRAWEAEDRAWNKMHGLGLTPEEQLALRIARLEKRVNEVEADQARIRDGMEGQIIRVFVGLSLAVLIIGGAFCFLRWLWNFVTKL